MTNKDSKALVVVLEDVETAHEIIEKLHTDGYSTDKLELVTTDVQRQAPQIQTPYANDTTLSDEVEDSVQDAKIGAGIGLGAGLLGAVLTGFPGIGLAMIAVGGLVGGAMGFVAGTERANEDDTVDLPKVKEYEQLLKDGHSLVVVLGTHDEVHRAEEIVKDMAYIHSHIHRVNRREFHEHPSND